MNLSTRHLRAFLALAQQRNFTRAAASCHLSQSAFSALIQSLEEDAGARLFDRHTRRVELTAEGRLFEQSAARLLADFEAAYSELQDHVGKRRGRVSVAALPSLAAGTLPQVLAKFHAKYPGVDLELFDSLSDRCIALVQSGRVDFALASAGGALPGLHAELLCADSFHLVCHAANPLARKRSVQVADLASYPFIHMARSTSIRQHLEHALHPARPQVMMEVEHLATAAALVAQGLGISVIPSLALFQFRLKDVVVRPLKLAGLQRPIHIVRPEGRALSVAAGALLEMVKRAF
ncbi:LysR family transcriptional regulator [soil metagenome]